MEIVVQKYGGTSLSTLDKIRRVTARIHAARRSGKQVVVVVSARGHTTDELLAVAGEITPTQHSREIDQLLVTGENASAALLALSLSSHQVPAISLIGHQSGIRAVGAHGFGVIERVDTDRVLRCLRAGLVVVVAGFQGVDNDGDVLTLGRGGSDTTAVALAAELRADACEIYTDVAGIYTADPRVVPEARLLPYVDSAVMAEMAFAGARVMHSRAVEIAAMHGIDLHVRHTTETGPGTVIVERKDSSMLESRGVFVAITHDLDVARVLVQSGSGPADLAADVLEVMAKRPVPVDMIARSGPNEDEFRMGFTMPRGNLPEIVPALMLATRRFGGRVDVDSNVGKVSLIGVGLLNRPEYPLRVLAALGRAGIATTWLSATQSRVSVTVAADRVLEAVSLLHREFALERTATRDDTLAASA